MMQTPLFPPSFGDRTQRDVRRDVLKAEACRLLDLEHATCEDADDHCKHCRCEDCVTWERMWLAAMRRKTRAYLPLPPGTDPEADAAEVDALEAMWRA